MWVLVQVQVNIAHLKAGEKAMDANAMFRHVLRTQGA